jgi:hypothetical protein
MPTTARGLSSTGKSSNHEIMSTNMNTNTIDLSKCKPGDKVKLRNGGVSSFQGEDSPGKGDAWPYYVDGFWYNKRGIYARPDEVVKTPHPKDIIAILPAKPRKKPAPKLDKALIRKLIKNLEGLL